jgi:hypothetical protein
MSGLTTPTASAVRATADPPLIEFDRERMLGSADSPCNRDEKMLTKERRPDFKTVDRWATSLLREAGAIHECDHHGWAKDRTDPHARAEALRMARNEPLPGLSPDEAVEAVSEALASVGDTCPEC